ncbi:hypothetical protein E2C01_035782 [Portunus trituberculatus]|uniref:Uncharacterized protein n=1 Tax=Portunus trituberculatus TaxID=210409 RepID=A0A5B7FAN2_PORTR|nr:hypothetical protein [Portunus trituberculatus]
MRNVRLHARHYHLCYAVSSQRWVSDTETVITPEKISKIPPQVPPTDKQNARGAYALGGS